MKRTKDGGAILEYENRNVKISKKEFEKERLIRNISRVLVVLFFSIIYVANPSNEWMGLIIIGIVFFMLGWRIKTGW